MTAGAPPPGSERAIYATFALQAFASGAVLTRVPDLQVQAGLSETQLGLAFTLGALGSILSSMIAGNAALRFGTKRVNGWSIIALAVAAVFAALGTGPLGISAAFCASGVMFGFSNVAMNLEADRFEAATGTRIMNRCHGMWSIGVLASTGLGVGARAMPVPTLWHMLVMLAVVAMALLWLQPQVRPAPRRGNTHTPGSQLARPDMASVVLVLFAFVAGTAHMAANTWAVIFARDNFAAADWIDTLTLPAFLLAMTVGRLYADRWVERYGAARMGRILAAVTAVGTVALVLAPSVWVAILGFALVGLGTGPLFPLMVSAAGRSPHRPAEEAVAAAILLISATGVVTPIVFGWLAEAVGLRWSFAALLPLCAVTIALSARAARGGGSTAPKV
ncbi:integral membrane transport protein [Candidatus Rhodobacter oscarellae]|uniref:Integral membrane transport protein n=1 Tax=Candidatus Rhodobacter oscarellae TaxID=1675527 RepID=A0A0J9H402_9RHOB|nr:MFS transporter [Candidatus Rhodobacter lobularis]KMW60423.1 integral membrane transport protein [Candidatus Rhodobacter lobularis]